MSLTKQILAEKPKPQKYGTIVCLTDNSAGKIIKEIFHESGKEGLFHYLKQYYCGDENMEVFCPYGDKNSAENHIKRLVNNETEMCYVEDDFILYFDDEFFSFANLYKKFDKQD